MRPDALVIRHGTSGAPADVAAIMDCPVINAGDGVGEHPTQALLDAATIRQHFGRIDGLKIAICGDLKHSRVARSNAKLLERLGAKLRFAPASASRHWRRSINQALEGADVVMMLRVQRERRQDLGVRRVNIWLATV
jgi:aspartate carbamoyltransferase catalytic subunit